MFKWVVDCGNNRCKNGCFRLKQQFGKCNIANIFFNRSTDLVAKDYVKQKIKQNIHDEYIMKWHNELERNLSRSGLGRES